MEWFSVEIFPVEMFQLWFDEVDSVAMDASRTAGSTGVSVPEELTFDALVKVFTERHFRNGAWV